MKLVRKNVILLLAVVLVFGTLLAACGGGNNANTPSNSTPTATPAPGNDANDGAPAASDLERMELRMIFPGNLQTDSAMVEEAMNEILLEKINATIKVDPIDWGQWDNTRNLIIASRENVDVIFTAQWSGHPIDVAKGAFVELNRDDGPFGNLLEQYGQGILESQDPAFLEGAAISGWNYAIPTSKELAASGGVVYRLDVAEELGLVDELNAVEKIEDLIPILEKVKAGKPDMVPIHMREGDNFQAHHIGQYDPLGVANIPGFIYKNQDSTQVITKFESDVYLNTAEVTREMFVKGLINQDAATSSITGEDAMGQGNVFMSIQSLKPGKDKEMEASTGLIGRLAQQEFTDRTVSTGDTAGSMLGISTTSSDPARAMMFINLLHTDKDLNNLLNFGIEGVHYTKDGEIITATEKGQDYAPGAAWMFGNQFLNYIWSHEAPDKWEQFQVFNDSAMLSPGLGFTFDVDPVSSEVATLVNVEQEFSASIETGSVEPGPAIAEYERRMLAAGMEVVVAEKQRQLDEFLATK